MSQYNTPELSQNLKESFKQIIKKQDPARYETLEKQQKINQQKQQKKAQKQENIAKIFQKLPFGNKTLIKKEGQIQEIIQDRAQGK